MKLELHSISEREAGTKWQRLFHKHWPSYRSWYLNKSGPDSPNLEICIARLKEYMPEFYPTYLHLCELAGDDEVAHRFLSGYCPPPYMSGCAQVVNEKEAQLVRNYDFAPKLSEGTLLHSAWNGKEVMAMGDSLIGVVDGLNENGLVVSLTFGGRKVVGEGFGIPFILRYVLEFCTSLDEAIEVLLRIPSHMSYNIMLMNSDGEHKLVQVSPDSDPIITNYSASTNHQGKVDWPEHANFTKTIERELYLLEMLAQEDYSTEEITQAFLKPPLFNRKYRRGFGTIYTAVYDAKNVSIQLHWPNLELTQSISDFKEGVLVIRFKEGGKEHLNVNELNLAYNQAVEEYWLEYGRSWSHEERHINEALNGLSLHIKELVEQINLVAHSQSTYPKQEPPELWKRVSMKK
jgi:predicted choloylglycine hydrolase